MTIRERVQQRIKEMRPMQVTKNGKMIGYILNENEYREYCKMKLIMHSKEMSAKAKKRGLTAKKLKQLLEDE